MLKHIDDDGVREKMLEEIAFDVDRNDLYRSKFQTQSGMDAWPGLLSEAVRDHDMDWLAVSAGADSSHWNATYSRRKPSGGFTEARVPVTAPKTLAIGEFLRFYARALCLIALEAGRPLKVVRVLDVDRPRTESEAKIGTLVDPQVLLDDLRKNIGIDTFLGVPAGPNSGLGVELA